MFPKQALLESLKGVGVLANQEIYQAFEAVDRKDFVNEYYLDLAHEDMPLPIGFGQTISQPYTVAFMLNLLEPRKGQTVLDIGSGSGWTTSLLAHVVGSRGSVIGLEIVPELVKIGQKNLSKYHFDWAHILQANGKLGLPGHTFDRILISAGASRLPEEILKQLKPEGIMVIPIDNDIVFIHKQKDGSLVEDGFNGFAFVPLLSTCISDSINTKKNVDSTSRAN